MQVLPLLHHFLLWLSLHLTAVATPGWSISKRLIWSSDNWWSQQKLSRNTCVWLSVTPTDHTKPGFLSWLGLWKHIPLQTRRLLIFCVCLSPNKKAVGISWQREQPWKDIKVTKAERLLTLSCPPLAEKDSPGKFFASCFLTDFGHSLCPTFRALSKVNPWWTLVLFFRVRKGHEGRERYTADRDYSLSIGYTLSWSCCLSWATYCLPLWDAGRTNWCFLTVGQQRKTFQTER